MRKPLHERFPLMTLELSGELPDRVKSRSAVTRVMAGGTPFRSLKELVALAGKVRS